VSPNDDATLKDQTSIDAYGERHLVLSLGQIGDVSAKQYAKRVLAVSKDPQVYISGGLRFVGTMNAKNGAKVPVSQVESGQRVKIVDFVSDVIDVVGAGLTAIITLAEYSDVNGGTVSVSFGAPDNLAVLLARMPRVFVQTKIARVEEPSRR